MLTFSCNKLAISQHIRCWFGLCCPLLIPVSKLPCRCCWLQLNNVLIFILLAAAVVVAGLQEWIEFGLILAVVTINVLIGMVQEGKAEKAAEAIKAMLSASGASHVLVSPGCCCLICYLFRRGGQKSQQRQ